MLSSSRSLASDVGTSSSYKGSTSKAARDLRDGIGEWAKDRAKTPGRPMPQRVVGQALNIPVFARRVGDAPSGSGTSGSGKQSAPRRVAHDYASTAGRAAALARAFREGDRAALEKAGLDFDELQSLPSQAEMARAILDVVCDAQNSSDIPTEEQRDIASQLLDWVLDDVKNPVPPTAAATAEYAIGVMIAEIFISESGEVSSTDVTSRAEFVDAVYDTSIQLASRAELSEERTPPDRIADAIERGLRSLRHIYRTGEI